MASSPPSALLAESRALISGAVPISATYFLQFLALLVQQSIAGHIGGGAGSDSLAAVALSNFFATVSGNAPLTGLAMACDSLLPQALGAKNHTRAGHVAQRAVVALLLLCLPIAPLWWYAGEIFAVLQQDVGVVAIASSYARWLIVGLPAFALFEVFKKLVTSSGLFMAPLVLAALGLAVQAGLAYALVYAPGARDAFGAGAAHDMDGAALAFALSTWVSVVGGVLYLRTHRFWGRVAQRLCGRALGDADTEAGSESDLLLKKGGKPDSAAAAEDDPHDTLDAVLAQPLSLRAMTEAAPWLEFFAAGLPSLLMLVIEWGSFEALSVVAGTISAPVLAAHSILVTLEYLAFTPCLGISIVASIRAGNCMGARDAAGAIVSARAALVVVTLYGLFASALLGALHAAIVPVFTEPDSEAGCLVAQWSPILCAVVVFDTLQGTLGGLLRGLNRPVIGALSGVVSYLAIGMPLSFSLGKAEDWGLPGIWLGVGVSVASSFTIMGTTLLRLNWKREADTVADAAAVAPHADAAVEVEAETALI